MALLPDALYRHLCPPGAHFNAMNSLYASQATLCALGFAKIKGEMVILPPYHPTIRRGAATMALLRDAPYCLLFPPGAHSDVMNSLYASQATPCALGFAKIEWVTTILRGAADDSTTFKLQSTGGQQRVMSPPHLTGESPSLGGGDGRSIFSPVASSNNFDGHVSSLFFIISSKYISAFFRPTSRCCFC